MHPSLPARLPACLPACMPAGVLRDQRLAQQSPALLLVDPLRLASVRMGYHALIACNYVEKHPPGFTGAR